MSALQRFAMLLATAGLLLVVPLLASGQIPEKLIWRDPPPTPLVPNVDLLPQGVVAQLGRASLEVNVFSCSPDGRFFVTSDRNESAMHVPNTLRIWDAKTGQHVAIVKTVSSIMCTAFSPDGALIATGTGDGTLAFWETATGKLVDSHSHTHHLYSLAWSQDGKYLVSGSDKLELWDVKKGKAVREFEPSDRNKETGPEFYFTVALAPDGKTVASRIEGRVVVWEVSTGRRLHSFTLPHANGQCLVFTADSKTLIISTGPSGQVQRWDIATGRELLPEIEGTIESRRVLLPDSKWLAWVGNPAASDKTTTIFLRDLESGKLVEQIAVPKDTRSFVFTADSKGLVLGTESGWLGVYSVPGGKVTRTYLEVPTPIFGFLPGPKGSAIALTSEPDLQLWDLAKAQVTKLASLPVGAGQKPQALSADRAVFATVDGQGTLRFFNAVTANQLGTVDKALTRLSGKQSLRLSADGSRAVALATGARALVWDTKTGKKLFEQTGIRDGSAFGFSADGKNVIQATVEPQADAKFDFKVEIRDLVTGKPTKDISWTVVGSQPTLQQKKSFAINNKMLVHDLIPSPDGKFLAVVEETIQRVSSLRGPLISGLPDTQIWCVRVLDLTTGKTVITFEVEPENSIFSTQTAKGLPSQIREGRNRLPPVVWSPDSKRITSRHSAGIVVYEVPGGNPRGSPALEMLLPTHVGKDKQVYVTVTSRFYRMPTVTSLTWLPEGRILSVSDDRTIWLWDTTKMAPIPPKKTDAQGGKGPLLPGQGQGGAGGGKGGGKGGGGVSPMPTGLLDGFRRGDTPGPMPTALRGHEKPSTFACGVSLTQPTSFCPSTRKLRNQNCP